MAAGLAVSSAFASGEQTTAALTSPLSGTSTTFTWSYVFHANGGHGLSNIAISFCPGVLAHVVSASPSGEIFTSGDVPGGHTGFGPGVKFGTTAVSGTLTVVFDHAYAANGLISIQSHSGDGQVGDVPTTATGPGDCGPTPTSSPGSTTTTVHATTTTVPATTTTVHVTSTTVPGATTTTVPGATTTTVPGATTTTVPGATTTTVPGATTTTVPGATTTTLATTTTAVAAATTSTSVPTSVLGARFSNTNPSLAKTGIEGAPLVAAGAVVLVFGLLLLVEGRRESASE
jgi:hypothetical protein